MVNVRLLEIILVKKMKKFLCFIFIIFICANVAFAEENQDYVGFLTRLKTTPEEFFMLMKTAWATKGWVIEGGDHSKSNADGLKCRRN